MSVIKVDTILNKDGTSGPILSGLTTVGIITSNLSIGSTTGYFEEVVAGVITSVTSIGVANIYASGSLSGDGSSITAINASNISSGTLSNSRLSSTVNVTNLESGQLNVSGVSTFTGTANFGGGQTQILNSGEIKMQNLDRIILSYSGDTPNGLVIRQNNGTASEIVNVGGDDIKIQADSGKSVLIGNDNDTDAVTINNTGVNVAGVVTATTFSGNLTGNVTGDVTGNADTATSATTATNANNINLADESSDTTCFPIFATAATGNQAGKTGTNLTFNSSTGRLAASIVQGNNIEADTNLRVGSATTSTSLYVVGNSASNVVGLTTQSSSFALDFSTGNNFAFTIGGNITLNNPTGITTGQSGIIEITQDGTGSRTMAFQSHWNFADGTAPTITAGAGTTSVLAYFVKDSDMIITTSILALG